MSRTLINGVDIMGGSVPAGSIDSSEIADGAIVNADINAAAAVALTKLAATTASRALVSDGSGFITPATTTATEIGFVNGVTSAIQTQLNTKITSGAAAIVNADVHAAAAIALTKLAATTASRALVSDGSGFITVSAATATEVSYLSGVTSAIQTQLNAFSAANGSVLLASYAPSAVATLDITSIITTTYEHYEIRFWLLPGTDDVELLFRTDSDNGASFDAGASDYNFINNITTAAGATATYADDAHTSMNVGQNSANASIGSTAGSGVTGVITLHTGSASTVPRLDGRFWYTSASGTHRHIRWGGSRLSAATINALQFLFESGNIGSGEVQIYGLKQS